MKTIKGLVKGRFYIPLLLAAFLCLLMTRRWCQIVSPQVWCEDGTQIIYGFMTHGWIALLQPVNGYLITVPKIISMISLWVSFLHYPIVSTILSWGFIVSVGLAIAISPTRIHGKFLCAAAAFMIPSDPEVFGLPLYTFWWAALLLFLVAVWDEKRPTLGWRLCFLLLGGLSSPVIILVLPILYFRVYLYRSLRSEYVIAFVATLIAVVQIFFISAWSAGHIPPLNSVVMNVIPVFFGKFMIGNWTQNNVWLWVIGLGLIFVVAAWFYQNRCNAQAWVLLFLLVGSIGLSIARVDPAIMDPRLAGPRYFFFPFILTFWILIQYFHTAHRKWFRTFLGIVAMVAIINGVPAWSRQHDDLHWAAHVRSCRLFPEYSIPVQYDGHRSSAWSVKVTGKSCDELLKRDLFVSKQELESLPTFAYTVFRENMGANKEMVEFINSSKIDSLNTSGADTGEISLKLRRGDRILYRSYHGNSGQSVSIEGYEREFIPELPSAHDWVTLEFSNSNLPAEFVVRLKDEGQARGKWLAIAIETNPEYADAYYNRAVIYGIVGNHRQAISDFDRAIEINPKYADAYNGRGVAYCKLGNYTQAIPDFDRAIEINPDYAMAYYSRGFAYGKFGNYTQAISDFDRAIAINPKYANAYYNRAVVYGKLGNHSQEIEDLQKAARLGSEDAKKRLLPQRF